MLELPQNLKQLDQNARRYEGQSQRVDIIVSVREIHGRTKSDLSNVFGIRTVLALTDPIGWRYLTTVEVVERQYT